MWTLSLSRAVDPASRRLADHVQRQLGNPRRSINRLKRDSFLTEPPSRDEKLEVEWQRLLQDDEVVQEDEIGQITDAIKARWFSPVLFRVFPQFVHWFVKVSRAEPALDRPSSTRPHRIVLPRAAHPDSGRSGQRPAFSLSRANPPWAQIWSKMSWRSDNSPGSKKPPFAGATHIPCINR